MKDPVTDLTDRLALLVVRYNVAFNTGKDGPGHYLCTLADYLIGRVALGDQNAVSRLRAVVEPADLASASFWATPLGRLLFAAGGCGPAAMTQQDAADVLGCSRQYVNELVTGGRLLSVAPPAGSRARGRLVDTAQVRALLAQRLDKLVKQNVS
jgi:hypothetical protein